MGTLKEVGRKFRRRWKKSLNITEQRIEAYKMPLLYLLERCIMQRGMEYQLAVEAIYDQR